MATTGQAETKPPVTCCPWAFCLLGPGPRTASSSHPSPRLCIPFLQPAGRGSCPSSEAAQPKASSAREGACSQVGSGQRCATVVWAWWAPRAPEYLCRFQTFIFWAPVSSLREEGRACDSELRATQVQPGASGKRLLWPINRFRGFASCLRGSPHLHVIVKVPTSVAERKPV